MNRLNAATLIAAMALCAPLQAQTFDACRAAAQDWRTKEVAARCAGVTGDLAVSCQRRVAEVYMSMVRRCTDEENTRMRREAAQARERAAAERAR